MMAQEKRPYTGGHGRYPARPRPLRPHGFVVGNLVGERVIERVTTTRVILKCKCGAINCVTIRRLEAEQPKTCRACATKVKPGTRGAIVGMHIGQRFGTRTVRGFIVRPASEGGTVVELDCDCGTPGVAFPRKLAAGLNQSCPRCADRRRTPLRDRAC